MFECACVFILKIFSSWSYNMYKFNISLALANGNVFSMDLHEKFIWIFVNVERIETVIIDWISPLAMRILLYCLHQTQQSIVLLILFIRWNRCFQCRKSCKKWWKKTNLYSNFFSFVYFMLFFIHALVESCIVLLVNNINWQLASVTTGSVCCYCFFCDLSNTSGRILELFKAEENSSKNGNMI